MTNSIASSKCLPPVLTSGNYGMSQNRHIDESKEYIFVKLTDSAYRAVEEYQRNEHAKRFNNGQCAKIQLVGNSGVIHFPTPDNGEGRKFGFAIDDIEGSLECIQQTENELDVLGSLPLRMRIHANDDVYDTTRTKMAIAEETEKSKCIREIKPNQTDIGRKVKKPAGAGSAPGSGHGNGYHRDPSSNNQVLQTATSSSSSNFLSNSNNRSKVVSLSNNTSPSSGAVSVSMNNMNSSKNMTSSRSPNPTLLGGSTTTGSSSSNNRYNSPHNNASLYGLSNSSQTSSALPTLTTASSLSSALTAGLHQTTHSCSNGYSSASSGSPPEISNSKSTKMSLSANSRSSARPPAAGGLQSNKSAAAGANNKIPDISKRKLRERLIHLLALKPFKKPELYARLANEGIRDKDRLSISNTLKDIAALSRDNTYNLKRPMWNDVNENWPFYTEQETQQLKRRKPQNLTPPLSSDAGSSTSGQSPTSTHTGSPPPLVGSHSGSMKRASLERDPYDDGSMTSGMQAKKQRISHFKKDVPLMTSANIVGGGANARLTYGNSNSYGQHNSGRNSAATYSPHGSSNHADSENPNNTDLSYNVLDNVDDFMPHVEQQSGGAGGGGGGYFGGNSNSNSNSRKNMHSNKNSTSGNPRDKRVSNSGFVQQHERTSNKEMMMKKKSSASPTIYSNNFVPEKSSSSRGSSANSYQRQSPSYTQQQQQQQQQQQHHKTSNSVIFSPKTQTQASPKDDLRANNNSSSSNSCNNNNNNGSSSNKYHHNQQQQQQQSRSGRTSATANHSRTPTPPMAQQQSQHYQQQQQQQNVAANHQHQPAQQQQQESPPQQLHSSPTQQIAAAVSSYAAASSQTSQKHYDFSNYTPITSIEQRRHYKTEFESDYDEYRKLLAQIEGVSMRFRGLAERLENAHKGCPDYYNIKQQIVSEYERIRNEEGLQREKQRFDYLHEKLAHIKQLVTDYDKTLTSASAAAQQQLLLQQQQQAAIIDGGDSCASQSAAVPQATNALSRNTRLSPMVGDNSHSPTTTVQYQQQQQQQHQQHHAAETIQPSQPQQQQPQLEDMPQYNGHAPAQAPPPVDSDSDDSSDSNDDDDDDSNDADSHDDVDDDEDDDDDDDEDIDNERY